MAKTKIGSNAIFTGTQEGLTVIGQHCYAYSGKHKPVDNPDFLKFTTGSGYIVGRFEMNADFKGAGGNDYAVTIKFNGLTIIFEQDIANNWLAGDNQYDVVIPPYTNVEGTLYDGGGSGGNMNLNFTGRVYA